MPEPNPILSTYEKICREKCEWCASDVRKLSDYAAGERFHEPAVGGQRDSRPCTAPTKDEVIEALRSALGVARKAVEDANQRFMGLSLCAHVDPRKLCDALVEGAMNCTTALAALDAALKGTV